MYNRQIKVYNWQIEVYNRQFEVYNWQFEVYNQQIEVYNRQFEVYNRQVEVNHRQFEVYNRQLKVYNRQFKVLKLKNKNYLCGTYTLPYQSLFSMIFSFKINACAYDRLIQPNALWKPRNSVGVKFGNQDISGCYVRPAEIIDQYTCTYMSKLQYVVSHSE